MVDDQMMMASHDLKPNEFPMHVEFFTVEGNRLVYEETIAEPGVMRVPGLAKDHGRCWVRITFGNGMVVEHGSH